MTRREAAMAHDKYSLLLNGIQGSSIQYPLVDSLMAEEEASSLLNALGVPCTNENPDIMTQNVTMEMHQVPGNVQVQTTGPASGSNQMQAGGETSLPTTQRVNPILHTPFDTSESLSQQLAAIESSIQNIQRKGQGKRAADSQDVHLDGLDADEKKTRSEQVSPRCASEYADAAIAAVNELGAQLGTAPVLPRPAMVNSLHSDVDQDAHVPPPTVRPIPPFPKQSDIQ
jgi:hypothetical protein